MTPSEVPAVILCGGRGTRAWPLTQDLPKPLLAVGDRPVVHHLIEVFHSQGVRDLVLATGYRGELVQEWADSVVLPDGVTLTCVDTGEDTGTGERLRRARPAGPFFATYGDGLGDVDLQALLARHRSAGRWATVTSVPLPSQYGTLDLDDADAVTGFQEKPRLRDHWINAGFFVFEPAVFDELAGEDLERDVLPELAAKGELVAHKHEGFWRSMDTQKDVAELNALATGGGAPWLLT